MIDEEKLAYWVGVAQTDGCLNKRKINGKIKISVDLGVNEKSMNMMNKFREYNFDLFGRNPVLFYNRKDNIHVFRMGASKLLQFFKDNEIDFSDPPKPPKWVISNRKLFGAYLAGTIDGDGDVRIKGEYPQCFVRISSGGKQDELRAAILENMGCGVHICKRSSVRNLNGREIRGTWFELEFCVSRKNMIFFKDFIVNHVAIDHKRNKLKKFIENRYAPSGI